MDGCVKTIQMTVEAWADPRVAEILSQLRSPGLPRFYQSETEGLFEVEYLAGRNLRQLDRQEVTAPSLETWFHQVLDLLALICLVGGRPFAHLDLSAENILVSPGGRACLIDYETSRFLDGLARSPDHKRRVTAGYAAPEIFFGSPCPESDLYSLAMTILAVLTDRTAAELDERSIRKVLGRFRPTFAQKLRFCLSEDPVQRRRALAGTFYGSVLMIGEKRVEAVRATPPAPPLSSCPFAPADCPFLAAAARIGAWHTSPGSACYNEAD